MCLRVEKSTWMDTFREVSVVGFTGIQHNISMFAYSKLQLDRKKRLRLHGKTLSERAPVRARDVPEKNHGGACFVSSVALAMSLAISAV